MPTEIKSANYLFNLSIYFNVTLVSKQAFVENVQLRPILHQNLDLSWFLYRTEASSYFCRQFTLFRYGSRASWSLPQNFRILVPCEVSFTMILHLDNLNGELQHFKQASCQTPPITLHPSPFQFILPTT